MVLYNSTVSRSSRIAREIASAGSGPPLPAFVPTAVSHTRFHGASARVTNVQARKFGNSDEALYRVLALEIQNEIAQDCENANICSIF